MSKSEALAQELSSLFDELTPENIATFDEDQILEMRKKMYPYGRTIEGSDNVLTFCITDLDKKFKQRLLMTSLIGFLNRKLDEWHVPDGIPVVPVYDYVKSRLKGEDPLAPTDEELKRETEKFRKERKENEEWMQKRIIVKEFLEDMFQFNPDEHVRSSYKPDFKNPDREVVDTPAGSLAINHRCRKSAEFKDMRRQWLAKTAAIETQDTASGETTETDSGPTPPEKGQFAAPETKEQKQELEAQKDETVATTTREMIPPDDVFHLWNYYTESNYDSLLAAVADLYCEVPWLDVAVNPLAWHNDVDDADTFIHKHKSEVITEIFKAHSGKWNFYAPYKKVRDSTRYFNEKTILLEEMMKKHEEDARIGEELMKNKIRKKKRKNIEEEGPDDPQFLKWKKNNTSLKDMGATEVNQASYADDDCPDDGIQVDVFRVSQGGKKMEKSKFYSKAQAPEFMAEDTQQSARQQALTGPAPPMTKTGK